MADGSGSAVKENPGRKRALVDASDVFWVMAFIFVVHKFDLIDAVRFDDRIHRFVQRRALSRPSAA